MAVAGCWKPEQAVKLEELLAANTSLTTAYVLKDQLKTLWFAKDETVARARWQRVDRDGARQRY